MLRIGIWVENFKRAVILFLEWQGENLALRRNLKFPTFKLAQCSYRLKVIQLRAQAKFSKIWWIPLEIQYRILAGTMYRLKVGNLKCCRIAKSSPCHCKSKITAHLKPSTQMLTLNIFKLKRSFRKSVEYFWRYRIFPGTFPGTVYMLKVGNFKCCRCKKFSPCHCKLK